MFFHRFVWFTIKVSLHFYFFALSKGVDDAQSFLSYVHQTLFSRSILFSIMRTSITEGIMMSKRQL